MLADDLREPSRSEWHVHGARGMGWPVEVHGRVDEGVVVRATR